MNDETVVLLNRELDGDRENQTLRMALADRLEEINSPLAAGYRALAMLGRRPDIWPEARRFCWWPSGYSVTSPYKSELPTKWHDLLPISAQGDYEFNTCNRQQCEDAAAEAWLELSPEDQEQILHSALEPIA